MTHHQPQARPGLTLIYKLLITYCATFVLEQDDDCSRSPGRKSSHVWKSLQRTLYNIQYYCRTQYLDRCLNSCCFKTVPRRLRAWGILSIVWSATQSHARVYTVYTVHATALGPTSLPHTCDPFTLIQICARYAPLRVLARAYMRSTARGRRQCFNFPLLLAEQYDRVRRIQYLPWALLTAHGSFSFLQ